MSSASTADGAPSACVDPGDRPSVLVIGLGNPLLGDDGVGWRVVAELEGRLGELGGRLVELRGVLDEGMSSPPAHECADREGAGERPRSPAPGPPVLELDCLAVGGLGLMERLVGTERAILVDAFDTGPDPPGTVLVLPFEALPVSPGHLDGAHDAPLGAALAAGRALGAELPRRIDVVAIRADAVDTFGEGLSPDVERAIPEAVDAVLALSGLTGTR